MEKNIGVWLDKEKAYIISLLEGEVNIEKVESEVETRVRYKGETKAYSRLGNMFVNPQKKITERQKHQLKHFYEDIASRISDAEEIFLFGPSETKLHLAKHLSKDPIMCNKIRKVESEDHLTDNQMIARVKAVFRDKLEKEKVKVRARH